METETETLGINCHTQLGLPTLRVDPNSPGFGRGSPGSGCSAVIFGLEQISATNMHIQFSISMFC